MAIYVQMCVWRYMYKCAGSNIYIYMYKYASGDTCTSVSVVIYAQMCV